MVIVNGPKTMTTRNPHHVLSLWSYDQGEPAVSSDEPVEFEK